MNWLRLAVVMALAIACPILPGRAQPAPLAPPVPHQSQGPLRLEVKGDTNLAPGRAPRVQIAIKNRSHLPITLQTVTIGDKTVIDLLAGKTIAPGATVRWKGTVDVRMPPGTEYGPGHIVLQVVSDAGTQEFWHNVRRLEPLDVRAEYDNRPVFGGAEFKSGDLRSVRVRLKNHLTEPTDAQITLTLPSGWSLTDGQPSDTRRLRGGEQKAVTYKVLIPLSAPLGEHTVGVTVTAGGRTYTQNLVVAVTR